MIKIEIITFVLIKKLIFIITTFVKISQKYLIWFLISIIPAETNYQGLSRFTKIWVLLRFSLFHVTFAAETFSVVLVGGMKALGGELFEFFYLLYKSQ